MIAGHQIRTIPVLLKNGNIQSFITFLRFIENYCDRILFWSMSKGRNINKVMEL